jgi:diguanylate cyclase (GGDEF)-like protein
MTYLKNKPLNSKVKILVHSELIAILYNQIIHMLWAEAFAGALMFFILWWHGNRILLVSWAVGMVVLTGIPRYYITKFYAHAAKEKKHSTLWENSLMFLLVLAGIGWSVSGTLLLPTSDHLHESYILFLLVGVAAAANPFYSPIKKMYAAFLVPALFLTALYLLIQNTSYETFTGIALMAFGMLMLITSVISSELISNTLRLRFRNLELTKNLLKSNIRLENLASHDMLTQLPNRPFFYEKLERAIVDAKLNKKSFAILFLDLDTFKAVNDSLGHDTGDQLLTAVAQRLKNTIRISDIACRIGGDEFLLLLSDIDSPELAAETAEKICKALALPIHIKDQNLFITTSIGISIYPADGTDEKTLIQKADMAMYDSKNRSKGNYHFFNAGIDANTKHN